MKNLILDGQWQLKKYPVSARRMRDLDEGNWLNCSVPDSIYSCLIDAGVIDRKSLEQNPEDHLQISLEPWIFRKTFDLPDNFLPTDKVELVFDGLDTYASIWLNGKLLAKTDNMFCQWRIDASKFIKAKDNELLVKFDSAVEEGERLMKRYGNFDPTAMSGCSLAMRPFVRKAQCQFGWDWAPALPGCGIWQSVRIESHNKASLRDVHIDTIDCNNSRADIKISILTENFSQSLLACDISITDPAGSTAAQTKIDISNNQASAIIKIDNPQLWFPRPYGSQPLYKLQVKLSTAEEQLDVTEKTFGIRTAKINQAPDQFGKSFQFEINNQPVYAKGIDWIPVTLLIGSAKKENYEKLLQLAVDANINFIRVWGGGIFETDTFYETCDRLGIMVWQDFLFACSYYPDRTWFAELVKKEATQNITRLRNHPSLVVWCGNNEIDWQHAANPVRGRKFYGKNIYHSLLPQLVQELDPNRDYINSTPFGPAKAPNITSMGTVHQWDIWAGMRHTDDYLKQIPRFVSEFGFQGLPCKRTLQNLFDIDNKHAADTSLEKHDYMPNGTNRLHYYINELFSGPSNIEEFIYLSQVMQARAIKKNVEHLRSNSNINSGVLYWQFNDCCPSISWASLDYKNRKKALYYYTTKFFEPVIITASAKFQRLTPQTTIIDSITVSAVNHSISQQTALLVCRLVDTNLQVLDEFQRPLSISPGSVEKNLMPKSFINPQNQNKSFIHIILKNDDKIVAQNSFFYVPDKYFDYEPCDIQTQAERIDDLNWNLTVSGKKLAKDVYIDCDFDADLSDNYFDLLTHEPLIIKIKTVTPVENITGLIKICCINSVVSKS